MQKFVTNVLLSECLFQVGKCVLLETIHCLVNVGHIQLVPHCFDLICSSGAH